MVRIVDQVGLKFIEVHLPLLPPSAGTEGNVISVYCKQQVRSVLLTFLLF